MKTNPSRYELLESIATRSKEIGQLEQAIAMHEGKIKGARSRIKELETLNFLDQMLLNEIKE